MRSNSNLSMSSRVAWSITFLVEFSTNCRCRRQSWHLNRCLPLWIDILNRLRRSTNWAGRHELRATAITSTSLSLHFEHYRQEVVRKALISKAIRMRTFRLKMHSRNQNPKCGVICDNCSEQGSVCNLHQPIFTARTYATKSRKTPAPRP